MALPTHDETVDAYIAGSAPAVRERLRAIREAVRALAPQGEERISYGMPAFFCGGVVVYYAAFKRHIGVYPPVVDAALREQLARWAGPKGNLQFPHAEPLPLALITEVARARLEANRTKVATRAARAKPARAARLHTARS